MKQQINESEMRRALVLNADRREALTREAGTLRDQIRELRAERISAVPTPDNERKAKRARTAAQVERELRAEAAEVRLREVEDEIQRTDQATMDIQKKIAAVDAKAAVDLRQKVSETVDAAVSKALGRQVFTAVREKLMALQAKLNATEGELVKLLNTPRTDPATLDVQAEALLTTGQLPTAQDASISAEAKRLGESIRVLTAAARAQQARVQHAQAEYGQELNAALLATKRDVVSRLSEGLTMARTAVLENRLIRTAVGVATGGGGDELGCFTYQGVALPFPGDAFEQWQDRMRHEGLL
jgi:hypothetical protein